MVRKDNLKQRRFKYNQTLDRLDSKILLLNNFILKRIENIYCLIKIYPKLMYRNPSKINTTTVDIEVKDEKYMKI